MTGTAAEFRSELERIRRVSDMLCTGHAALCARYRRRALALDLSILGLATWLVALAFIEPRINLSLTPFGLDPQVWAGLLAMGTLLLSIGQIKVDWKGTSDAHKRSFDVYAEVHREIGYLFASGRDLTDESCRRILGRYDVATSVGIEMPEADFLSQKRRHQIKVAVSKHLDSHPSASILLIRIKLWARDNLRGGKKNQQ